MNPLDPKMMQDLQEQGEKEAQRNAQIAAHEAQKQEMLGALLDQPARARLQTVKTVNPGKAEMVENTIIRMAQQGQIGGKLGEPQLLQLLTQITERAGRKTTKIKMRRRDSDSDDAAESSDGSDPDDDSDSD